VGDARVGLVGFPSVGKSTLLTKITGTFSEAAGYEFTTLTCIPGMIRYRGAKIQLLDLPGIIEGAKDGKGRGRQVGSTSVGGSTAGRRQQRVAAQRAVRAAAHPAHSSSFLAGPLPAPASASAAAALFTQPRALLLLAGCASRRSSPPPAPATSSSLCSTASSPSPTRS
jgi:GTPase SAR1 family protein